MANKKDSLGDRMKSYYENITRAFLPRRTYTVIRIDGKAFHSYTKGLVRPFDKEFMDDMDETAKFLCEQIQGAKMAFVQSDEISILLTDFDKLNTSAWFDGNIQKMVSVSASIATAKFNELRNNRRLLKVAGKTVVGFEKDFVGNLPSIIDGGKLAMFDSRVFTIPSKVEVMNYFIWRQQDTVRNSISSMAQELFSHKELHGKNTDQMQDMCFTVHGVNWNDYSGKEKRGRLIMKETGLQEPFRTKWVSIEPPTFTKQKEFLNILIPNNE